MNAVPFTLLHGSAPARSTRQPAPWAPPPASAAASARLLGHFASLLLLAPVEAGAGKAVELDGELLACCAEAVEADRAAERCLGGVETIPFDAPEMRLILSAAAPFLDAYEDALRDAAQIPARTPEGLRCKAQLLLHAIAADGVDCEPLAGSLARDIAGRA